MTITVDVEAFKNAGFSFEEIQSVIKAEEEFERTGITHSHEEVKALARKKLFSKAKAYV